jgi:hypothetical protein
MMTMAHNRPGLEQPVTVTWWAWAEVMENHQQLKWPCLLTQLITFRASSVLLDVLEGLCLLQ